MVSALAAANPAVNAGNLQIGQTICIPFGYPYNTGVNYSYANTGCIYYQIKSGNTYYSLANGNDYLISQLVAYNPTLNPGNLQVNQLVCIPAGLYAAYTF